jgi:transposase InsO family protein
VNNFFSQADHFIGVPDLSDRGILLNNYYSPAELEARISEWVSQYNNDRCHKAIDNVTPSDRFFGREKEILEQRQKTTAETISLRRK